MSKNLAEKIDQYATYLPMEQSEWQELKLHPAMQERLLRIRGLYAHWLQFPSMSPKDLVEWNIQMHDLQHTMAYEDVQIVKLAIGNIAATSKDFMRWRVTQMLEEDRAAARRAGDFKSAVAAADKIAKYHQLDKPDTPDLAFDKIVYREPIFSDNLEHAGIKPNKNLRRDIEKLNKRLGREAEDAEYEEVKDE